MLLKSILIFIFVVISIYDWRTHKIPDRWNAGILLVAVLLALVDPSVSWQERILGMFAVSVPMACLLFFVPGSFGGGDIKFVAAVGIRNLPYMKKWSIFLSSSHYQVRSMQVEYCLSSSAMV